MILRDRERQRVKNWSTWSRMKIFVGKKEKTVLLLKNLKSSSEMGIGGTEDTILFKKRF